MEIKIVYNILLTLLVSVSSSLTAISQEKYLHFDPKKDSIVNIDKNDFYKIDNNLFDINRYHQIDTITFKQFDALKFSTVNDLYNEGKKISNKYFENLKDNEPIILEKSGIETYNYFFKYIYIIENISKCKYKKTRVWWIDY